MTTEAYASLMVQLDQRFRDLGLFCNEIPTHCLKAMLRGEMLMVVVTAPYCSLVWFPATEKPLEELFAC